MAKGVNIRVDDDTHEEWKAAAARQGVSLSELIRVSVGRALVVDAVGGRIMQPEPTRPERPKARRNVTATPATCDRRAFHRAGVFCKTCGTTPAR